MSTAVRIRQWATAARDTWNAFWFPVGPPHALAWVRIGFGIYWAIRFALFAPHVELLFSRDGWHFPYIEYPNGIVDGATWFFAHLGQPVSAPIAWALYLFTCATIVAFTLGWQTRVSLAAFLAMFVYYWVLYLHMTNSSYDRMQIVLLAILVASPCGKALSVDAHLAKRARKPFDDTYPLWTGRLIAVHVSIIYFGTGLFKMVSPSWDTGEVVGTAMISEWGSDLSYALVRQATAMGLGWGIYDLAVLGTVLFELYAGVALFVPKLRRVFFVIGTLFHTQIWVLLKIPQFMFLPMTYFVYADPFYVRDKSDRFTALMSQRFGGKKNTQPKSADSAQPHHADSEPAESDRAASEPAD